MSIRSGSLTIGSGSLIMLPSASGSASFGLPPGGYVGVLAGVQIMSPSASISESFGLAPGGYIGVVPGVQCQEDVLPGPTKMVLKRKAIKFDFNSDEDRRAGKKDGRTGSRTGLGPGLPQTRPQKRTKSKFPWVAKPKGSAIIKELPERFALRQYKERGNFSKLPETGSSSGMSWQICPSSASSASCARSCHLEPEEKHFPDEDTSTAVTESSRLVSRQLVPAQEVGWSVQQGVDM
ncbi:hypothetical protein B0H11DRAFT_1939351 [Mycena galericulata]|nr:hypothetical protein B0H11DRAFT_1939351 [Mycena galericulata]